MHGTLILETHSARNAIPALLAALIVSAAAMAALARRIPLDGGRFAAAAAILTYVCFRLLYPLLSDLLPGGEAVILYNVESVASCDLFEADPDLLRQRKSFSDQFLRHLGQLNTVDRVIYYPGQIA